MSWTEDEIQAVWNKGEKVPDYSEDLYRKDQCGAWIRRDKYGDRDDNEGWEIDHITPVSKGGTDKLSNLRPLQWKNNAGRGDERLTTIVTSKGLINVCKDDDAA